MNTKIAAKLLSAAINVRNAARASDDKRTERAREILKNGRYNVWVGDKVAIGDFVSSDDKRVYFLFIREDGLHNCSCPDAEKGNLCKHQRALAAWIISENAKMKKAVDPRSVLSSLVC